MTAKDTAMHSNDPRFDATREIRAPRGTTLHYKNWLTEAACSCTAR